MCWALRVAADAHGRSPFRLLEKAVPDYLRSSAASDARECEVYVRPYRLAILTPTPLPRICVSKTRIPKVRTCWRTTTGTARE